ncbi:MAG: GldG family protein [Leptospira sp.]|nr:GldG family protein [Leptospira sp.]
MERIKQILNRPPIIIVQIILLFLLSNYFLSGFNCRLDVSKNGRFTLTNSSKTIIDKLPDTLYIDAYYSSDIPPEYKSRISLAQEMLRELSNVNSKKVVLRFYDPDSSNQDKEKAIEAGIEPQTLQKVEMSSAQVKSAFMGVSLRLGKEVDVIPVVFFAEEVEYQILSTLKKMLRRSKGLGSTVAILQESGSMTAPLPGPRSGKDTFGVFMHQVFAPEYGPAFPFSLNEDSLPADVNVLLAIGSPELSELGCYHLDQFLMRGGKIFFLPKSMEFQLEDSNPQSGLGMGQKGFAQGLQNTQILNEFFSHYGFQIGTNMILEPNNGMPMGPLVQMEEGLFGRYHYPLWILATKEAGSLSSESSFTKDLEVLLLPWAQGLEILPDKQKNVTIHTIISSTIDAILKEKYLFVGEKEVFKIKEEPIGKAIPMGIHLKGKFQSYFADKDLPQGANASQFIKESMDENSSEILVVSSPYIVSDILVVRDFREIYQGANAPFFMNTLDILQGDDELVASRSKKPAFEALKNISKPEELFYSIVNILLLPLGIAVFAFFRIRRRELGLGGKVL